MSDAQDSIPFPSQDVCVDVPALIAERDQLAAHVERLKEQAMQLYEMAHASSPLASRPPEAGGAYEALAKCVEALSEYVDRCCASGCGDCEKARAALAAASEIGVKP